MSAVSKKTTPPSAAARTNGSAASSSSTHCLLLLSPKLIMPRQIRDTRRPVEPRLTYSMNTPRSDPTSDAAHACGWYAAPGAASPPRQHRGTAGHARGGGVTAYGTPEE